MLQFVAIVGFIILAFGIMAIALHFSQYKKRENAGCCGGGSCASDGGSHSCYSSKADFVENIDKIKAKNVKVSN